MSLNFDRVGRSLARVVGGKYKYDKEDDDIQSFVSLKLTGDAKFQQVPDADAT